MKKIIMCTMMSLLLVGCSTATNSEQPYYIVDGKIYKCEIIKRGNVFPTVRYLKDGEWFYKMVYNSDIVYLSPEEVK